MARMKALWLFRGEGNRRNEKGQALVEFALVVPLLVFLLFGMLETGRMFNVWLVATNAAREGARLGSVQASSTAITDRVLTTAPTLVPSRTTVTVTNAQGTPGTSVTVRVQYSFQFVVPLVPQRTGLANPYLITTESTMRLE